MAIRLRVLIALSLAILVSPSVILGCPNCEYSPSNFGFCRYYFQVGYNSCSEYVADPFSGRTDCNFTGARGSCDWGGRSGPGPQAGIGDDCDYHDAVGNCMTDNPDTWGYA